MSTFEHGCDEYMDRFLAGARRGLARAGFMLMSDAVMDIGTKAMQPSEHPKDH